ncbi:Hypothetical_protein [Hexamita inflata]|uniref:Hypothetical_protein n=1 Tax=Hexamita inflata TaxID=28002 RepID=A0AA86TSL3_9EUKA|nr:Hypothetical protein HINF_LOCUS8478 [Hexamita inflata]
MAALITYVALFEFFLQLINVRCDLAIVMIHKLMNRVRLVQLQKMIVEILQCSKLVLTQVTCECSVFSYFPTRFKLFQVVQLHLQAKVLFLSLRCIFKHFWLSLKLFVVDQIVLGGLIGVCRSYFCFLSFYRCWFCFLSRYNLRCWSNNQIDELLPEQLIFQANFLTQYSCYAPQVMFG